MSFTEFSSMILVMGISYARSSCSVFSNFSEEMVKNGIS
jgi:hypothetical protein